MIKGQEIIFANDTVSVVCKAIEVNRGFSLWVPVDNTITIPFNKEEIVSSNSTVYGNVALEIIGDANLTPEINYNEVYKKFRAQNNVTAKASLNRGLNQSSSSFASESRILHAILVAASFSINSFQEFCALVSIAILDIFKFKIIQLDLNN